MIRIICCGNRDRGDDGAGLLVAEQLHQLGISAEICSGEASALIASWDGAPDVILVDAVKTECTPGTVNLWDANKTEIPRRRSASTHGFGVAEAITLARTIGRLPATLQVFGIEASSFELGIEISPAVEQAAKKLAQELACRSKGSADVPHVAG